MEDILIALLQFLVEFLVEMFSWFPIDWLPEPPLGFFGKCWLAFLFGCGLSSVSLLFIRHTWITHSLLRIVNLVTAPLAAGIAARSLARVRARRKWNVLPQERFWFAFWFTLGLVVIRFMYAVRA